MVYLDIKSLSKFSSQTLHDIFFALPLHHTQTLGFYSSPRTPPGTLRTKNYFLAQHGSVPTSILFFTLLSGPPLHLPARGRRVDGVGIV